MSDKIAREAKALRALRFKHAPAISRQATIVLLAAQELERMHKEMDAEAREIAGLGYETNHTVTFDEHGSINDQLDNLGTVRGAGIKDVVRMAVDMARDASHVETAKGNAPLPSE